MSKFDATDAYALAGSGGEFAGAGATHSVDGNVQYRELFNFQSSGTAPTQELTVAAKLDFGSPV